jgi:outer membrane biosynthesis protein TonB
VKRTRTLLHEPHARHARKCNDPTTESKKCNVICGSDGSDAPASKKKSAWSSFFGSSEEPKPKPIPKAEAPRYEPPKQEPVAVQPEPVVPEPVAVQPEPVVPEPVPVQPEPEVVSEPMTEPEPEPVAVQPASVEPETESESESESPSENGGSSSLSYRTRLENFYRKYNPSKIDTVDMMLGRFEGREEILFNSLTTKYGPEPEE